MGKQSKRKISKQATEAIAQRETVKQVPVSSSPEPLGKRWRDFLLPAIGLIVLAVLLIGKSTDSIMHPWTRADMLCDSAGKSKDEAVKKHLLNEAGPLIRESVKKHPYHARVWAIYGHYFVQMGNWDSSLIAEKKAIELGKGSSVNSIEPMAKYFMNIALKNKMEPIFKQKDYALNVLQDLEIPGYDNEVLNKFRGFVYVNNSEFAEANDLLFKYLTVKPNDFDVLYAVSVNYTNQGMKAEALSYANRARAIDPNSAKVLDIIRLNSQ